MTKNTDVCECEVDIAIIGAGAAGLTTAYQLQQKFPAKKFVILEAKDRVGGRLYSARIAAANGYDEWDLGGQWVASSQLHVMQLLKDFDIEVYSQFAEGKNKLIIDDLSDIRTYSGDFPKFGIFEMLKMYRFFGKVESMSKQIPLENPLDCKNLKEWDNQTADSMAAKEASFGAKKLFDSLIRAGFGCELAQVSLFFTLYCLALGGGFSALLDAQEFCVKGTMYGVMKKLETAVGIENIKTSDPVNFIEQCDDSTVLISTLKGARYRAKYVVCAIPPHLINQIHFTPPLPFNRQQLNQRMPMGNMIKCLATYKRAFWREKNLSGLALATAKDYTKDPICATVDATTSSGSPALVGFIAGEQAIYWSLKTQSERKKVVVDYFAAVFGEEAKFELLAYEDKDWSQEDYIGGCPGAVMQPGTFAYFQHALREPFGRVHFAGTETAQKWIGYVDGAVESGIRAAEEIGARMSSWPNDSVPSKIFQPSSVFNREVVHSSSTVRRVLDALFGVKKSR